MGAEKKIDPRPSTLDHPPDWKPAASREVIRLRAEILARIRGFFAEREVLEVETPLLSAETVTDPHIHSLTTRCKLPGGEGELYLQTSPEFAMKRLLAAGSGSIYQVCKAFRDGEAGSAHNPEFTILEWYRVGFDHHLLMDEVDELLRVLGISEQPAERLMYREAFNRFGGCDPFQAAEEELSALATESGLVSEGANGLDRDGLLDFLFSQLVQPSLAGQRPYFIHSYPSSQAALARINPDAPAVADRFELFFQGVELGNGYHELADSVELRSRFSTDLAKRAALGMPAPQPGEHFLSAMTYGLPDCAGVAVGVDRLVMLAAGLNDVRQVMTFPVLQA